MDDKLKEMIAQARANGNYIARNPACGCVCGIVSDRRDKTTAADVAQLIRDGLTISHVTWEEFQQIKLEPTFLSCPHGKEDEAEPQLALF